MFKFDAWLDFRTVEHLIVLVNEQRVKAMAQLEKKILEWSETDLNLEALQQREWIEMELKEIILRSIIKQNRDHFNPQSPSSHDDSAAISQLEMDVLCLSMTVKAKKQEHDLS